MWGRGDGERRIRCRICWRYDRGVEWIQEKTVIPEILVAGEHYWEVVPLVLTDPQARDVVRIAAVTEVAEVKAIEESSMVVQRPRTQRVIEQSQPGIEIYEGSIITLVPVNPRRPIACLRALLGIIIAGFDAFGFLIGIFLRPGKRGEKKQSACQQQTERSDSRTTIHGYSPYRM